MLDTIHHPQVSGLLLEAATQPTPLLVQARKAVWRALR